MEEIKETIKVFVRQRPVMQVADNNEVQSLAVGKSFYVKKDVNNPNSISGIQSIAENSQSCTYFSGISHTSQKFSMERFFGANASQNDLFESVAQPIVESCLQGYAGLILAYGPTGSGKTFTMRGSEGEARGIMPRCVERILNCNNANMEIWASYLQIYCENISDLLADESITSTTDATIAPTSLNLRTKPDGSGVYVEGLMKYKVSTVEDLMDILQRGDVHRSIAATNMNEQSSRSHAVLMLSIIMPDEGPDDTETQADGSNNTIKVLREGQLMLVDLAGSERANASEGRNYLRAEEAKAINLSLSALGNVMNALSEQKAHVPYRDSKLTRLLQNCLGGTARTAIIVTVIPGEDTTGETLNALRFASRASKVKVTAKISKHRNYEALYKDAMVKIKELEQQRDQANRQALLEDKRIKTNKIEQQEIEISMLRVQINQLQREIEQFKHVKRSSYVENSPVGKLVRKSSDITLMTPMGTSKEKLGAVFPLDIVGGVGNISPFTPGKGEREASNSDTWAGIARVDTNENEGSDAGTDTTQHELHETNGKRQTGLRATEDHLLVVESMSRTILQKTKEMKQRRLSQEVSDAEKDLKLERERHLLTVQELKAMHDRNQNVENYFNSRIEELMQELSDRQRVLDEQRQLLESERHERTELENEIIDLKLRIQTMVEQEQVQEMENLFRETIEKLNARVLNLEEQAAVQADEAAQRLLQMHQEQQQQRSLQRQQTMKQPAPLAKAKSAYGFWQPDSNGSGSGKEGIPGITKPLIPSIAHGSPLMSSPGAPSASRTEPSKIRAAGAVNIKRSTSTASFQSDNDSVGGNSVGASTTGGNGSSAKTSTVRFQAVNALNGNNDSYNSGSGSGSKNGIPSNGIANSGAFLKGLPSSSSSQLQPGSMARRQSLNSMPKQYY